MRNKEVAHALYEIADLMDIMGERFKPNAYRRAARTVEGLGEDISVLRVQGRLSLVPGIGEAIAEKIAEYLATGKIAALDELKNRIPAGVLEMLAIQGVGPKTVNRMWKELGLVSVDELRRAAETHQLLKLKGFGEKKESKILRGIRFLSESKKRTPLGVALPLAQSILGYLRENAPVTRASAAGSLRRMKESVGDLDILIVSSNRKEVVRAFIGMPSVREVTLAGETKATVILNEGLQVDMRVLDERSWGSGLQYFTGSVDHNVHLRTIAQKQGLKLSEYGVFRGEEQVAGETEKEVYEVLGLDYIQPEMREDTGEIEAAQSHNLPKLLEIEDVKGDFHVHTNASDGSDSLEDVVAVARARGYDYIGITEHSKSLNVARGLSEERLLAYRDKIKGMNVNLSGFRIMLGTECEILEDGRLDYSEDILRELDFVIASVHSKFNMTREEMTNRILVALSHPCVNILAHPFTGLIYRREPVQLDFERIAEEAANSGTALEINAFPDRLDLDGSRARIAKEKGAKLTINTDSHSAAQLDFMKFGVGMARRGWLEVADVVNCWPHDEVKEFFST